MTELRYRKKKKKKKKKKKQLDKFLQLVREIKNLEEPKGSRNTNDISSPLGNPPDLDKETLDKEKQKCKF